MTSRSACGYGSGRSRMAWTKVKTVAVPPIETAMQANSVSASRGVRSQERSANMTGLLVTKRFNRIETHGGARREIAGDQAHDEEENADDGKAIGIVRRNLDGACHQFREEIRAGEANQEAENDQAQPLPGDQFEDVTRLRAEGHAHADFLGALPHGVRHHAIEADCRQEKCEQRKNGEQVAEEFFLPKGI